MPRNRIPATAQRIIARSGKGLEIPEGGWTGPEFRRQGRLFMVTAHRMAQLSQRKAQFALARKTKAVLLSQIDAVLKRVTGRGVKAPISLDIRGDDQLTIWMQAIELAVAEMGLDGVQSLVPDIQSVLAQGFSRTGELLGEARLQGTPDLDARFLGMSKEIASKITRVSGSVRSTVGRTITRAVEEGLSITEVASQVRAVSDRFAGHRSLTIARTELNRAYTNGAIIQFQGSESVTHVSVIGCQEREPTSPTYRGLSTCNIKNVPVQDAHTLEWHINHTGTLVASNFRNPDGTVDDPGPVA